MMIVLLLLLLLLLMVSIRSPALAAAGAPKNRSQPNAVHKGHLSLLSPPFLLFAAIRGACKTVFVTCMKHTLHSYDAPFPC
jgi:hypothetical protein